MSAHPLLTRVIAKAIRAMTDGEMGEFLAIGEVAAIPSDIADRLERALDVCTTCGWVRIPDDPDWHERDWLSSDPADHHPFVPLVTP